VISTPHDSHITGIVWDSRKVQPGDVFFALVGGNVDGHQFIDGAVERGAAAVIGKATYMTWDPEANEGLGGYVNTGGNSFTVYAEDCNQPGIDIDRFWIRAVDKLVMSKPASSNAQTIGGGNIVVPHTPN
jgi:UDP-N-acetylmuramyl pentapeptide synthase